MLKFLVMLAFRCVVTGAAAVAEVMSMPIRSVRAALSIIVSGWVVLSVATASPATAATWPDGDGGYPYSDATAVNQAAYDWGYTSCKGYCGTFAYLNGVKYYTLSERGYAIRNCTDYVAWKLESLGISSSLTRGRGNGKQWDDNSSGVTITATPEVGDAAVFNAGTFGHVAFVEQIRPRAGGGYDALVSEYNQPGDGTFRGTRWVQADNYVDFNGVGNPLGVTAQATGTLLQVEHLSGASTWNWYPIRPDVTLVGAPSVIWSSGSPMAFGVGTDGALRQFTLGSGGWTPHLITRTGLLSSSGGVSAVQVGSNIEAFTVDASSHLLQVEYTPSTGWNWYPIRPDVTIVGAPSVIWGSGGPTVFAAGTDGALRQFSISDGGWTPHLITQTGLLSAAGGVSAVQSGGTYEVFTVDKNKHLLQVEYTPNTGWNWYPIRTDVTLEGTPAAIWSPTPTVFGVGTDGALRQYVLGSGWTPYTVTQLGLLSSGGGVSAVLTGGNYEVFTLQKTA